MNTAVIVAGGNGSRMQADVKKQYLNIGGISVLGKTLSVFEACDCINQICLVIPENDVEYCKQKIVLPLNINKNLLYVLGGSERQESVFNALGVLDDNPDDIVVIHDGVRPFIDMSQITECIDGAKEFGACILAVPAFDTIKTIRPSGFVCKTLDRDTIWLAQTPQAFRYDIIKKAHDLALENKLIGTDDSSLVENMGVDVKIIKGSRRNIKITTPQDLLMANIFIKE